MLAETGLDFAEHSDFGLHQISADLRREGAIIEHHQYALIFNGPKYVVDESVQSSYGSRCKLLKTIRELLTDCFELFTSTLRNEIIINAA